MGKGLLQFAAGPFSCGIIGIIETIEFIDTIDTIDTIDSIDTVAYPFIFNESNEFNDSNGFNESHAAASGSPRRCSAGPG